MIDSHSYEISVAICTYNGEARLPLVIDRLRSQLQIKPLRWELLIVDNNSTDGTAAWVQRLQEEQIQEQQVHQQHLKEQHLKEQHLKEQHLKEQHLKAQALSCLSIRYILEPQQGTAFARHRAIESACSPWVACLDDDNLPHPDWLAEIYDFAQSHPQAGAFHGKILGDYEMTPPPEFDRIAPFWAIGGGKRERCYTKDPNAARKRLLPPGAGIVVQRHAWLAQVPPVLNLVGRVGTSMVGGEDIEAMTYLSRAGWEIWYSPKIVLDHRIAHHRMTHDAVIRHMHGIGLGRWQLRRLSLPVWKQPIALLLFWLNDLRKFLQHTLKYRGHSANTVLVAEQAFFKGCLQSPFYGWLIRS